MNNSNESGMSTPRLILTPNWAYFKSPTSQSTDHGIDTPHKLPVAPHPSPINMDIESSNPKSKEIFRTELLMACQMKIPEALAKASKFNDAVLSNLSFTEEDAIPNLDDLPSCTGHPNKEKLEDNAGHGSEDKISNQPEYSQADRELEHCSKVFIVEGGQDGYSNPDVLLKLEKDFSFDLSCRSKHAKKSRLDCPRIAYSNEKNSECLDDEGSKLAELPTYRNQCDAFTEFEEGYFSALSYTSNRAEENRFKCPQVTYSTGNLLEYPYEGINDYSNKTQFEERPPILHPNLLDSTARKDGTSVFYDHATDHLQISKLLNPNSGWQDACICRSRSPGSDKISTIAVCSSDSSDISDGDLLDRDRSMDFHEDSGERRPNKKPKSKSSTMRRFLSWRRSSKMRKRTASLDESRFPFYANRFGSYKTEFELSV